VTPPGAADVPLFHIDELIIRPGDRVALLGPNGCGKTSLLTMIVAGFQSQAEAAIALSPQAKLGYYDQELQEVLALDVGGDRAWTMLEFLRQTTSAIETGIRNGLINAGFPYVDHERRISVLSGGERARLMFLRLRLNRPNFLIMDEPTNHIDIDGKEELEAQLSDAGATLLMTSHDRRFIDNVATRFLLVTGGGLEEIQDPESFYQTSAQTSVQSPLERMHTGALDDGPHSSGDTHPLAADEEAALERIIELETLLEADRARKRKFQKIGRQAAWQKEIELLNRVLDRGDS
jgi:ATPase subunit of ABC transporter with duplicated ATPase domains